MALDGTWLFIWVFLVSIVPAVSPHMSLGCRNGNYFYTVLSDPFLICPAWDKR